jgi:hypothetical protein
MLSFNITTKAKARQRVDGKVELALARRTGPE